MSDEGQKAANGEQEKDQRQDNDDATTYSGASTSRLASTPVEKDTTDNSNESSDKESKDFRNRSSNRSKVMPSSEVQYERCSKESSEDVRQDRIDDLSRK